MRRLALAGRLLFFAIGSGLALHGDRCGSPPCSQPNPTLTLSRLTVTALGLPHLGFER